MAFQMLKHCLGLRAALPAQIDDEPARLNLCDSCKQPLRTHIPDVEQKVEEGSKMMGDDAEPLMESEPMYEDTHDDESEEDPDADSDTESEEDPNEPELRRRWATFDAIPDSAFSLLVQQHMEKTGQPIEPVFTVEKRDHGSYNYVAILNNGTSKLVVKIPAIGLPDVWDPNHASIMRSEAHTLIYIKHRLPAFPCPTYLTRDETFGNPIAAPYILFSFLEGQQSYHLWYNTDADGVATAYANNNVTASHEALRRTFLTSLASTLAPLHTLTFPQIGMLHLPDESDPSTITIVPRTDFLEPCATLRRYMTRPTFASASEYYASRNSQITSTPPSATDLMRTAILSTPAFTNPDNEPFTLAPDDLDLQNILVDPSTGHVTGILDWDRIATAPPSTGFSTLPLFLQEDWVPEYAVPSASTLHPWTLARYRSMYADALRQACGEDKKAARWCEKSGMYFAVHSVMFGDVSDWVELEEDMLKEVMGRIGDMWGVEYEGFVKALVGDEFGGVWEEGKKVWEEGVRKLFDPAEN